MKACGKGMGHGECCCEERLCSSCNRIKACEEALDFVRYAVGEITAGREAYHPTHGLVTLGDISRLIIDPLENKVGKMVTTAIL